MSNQTIKWSKLNERSIIGLEGDGVADFLQRLITCDCTALKQNEIAFGALLTPQGKLLYDFFIFPTLQGFMIDIAKEASQNFIKKLNLYKLRAPISITLKEDIFVFCCDMAPLNEEAIALHNLKAHRVFQDCRHKDMGSRIYGKSLPKISKDTPPYHYHQQRIALGLSEFGHDFDTGEVYPHEILLDQYQGASNIVDHKGCYVGQEVVSRMKHKTTVRKRMVKISAKTPLPERGTEILAAHKKIGILASSYKNEGLALIRLDRYKSAFDEKSAIVANEVEITATLPNWVDFDWPQAQTTEDE